MRCVHNFGSILTESGTDPLLVKPWELMLVTFLRVSYLNRGFWDSLEFETILIESPTNTETDGKSRDLDQNRG